MLTDELVASMWNFGERGILGISRLECRCLFQRPLLADANIKIVEAVSKAHRMGHEAFGIVLIGNKYGTGEALAS